nr:hypothetical protein [Ruegeria sp. HKCCA5929]
MDGFLNATPPEPEYTKLPVPDAQLSAKGLVVVPPGSSASTLRGETFQISAGEALGVAGKSGSGKTSLAKKCIYRFVTNPIRKLTFLNEKALGVCRGRSRKNNRYVRLIYLIYARLCIFQHWRRILNKALDLTTLSNLNVNLQAQLTTYDDQLLKRMAFRAAIDDLVQVSPCNINQT